MFRHVLVTGANGFLGRHVCAALLAAGHTVRALVRKGATVPGVHEVPWSGLEDVSSLGAALDGIDTVVHLAARVHVMRDRATDPLTEYRRINVDGTRRLAEYASSAGVSEFFFASSVKAVGESNVTAWTEDARPDPSTPYGISKLEAEDVLRELAVQTAMQTVSLRLPLVYGAGVGGNMLRLFNAVDRGWPLPLRNVHNRRSLVYAGNAAVAFTGLIGTNSSGTYFVSDGEDVSTAELVRRIGAALCRKPRLIAVPLLNSLRILGGRRMSASLDRLIGSLTVDSHRIRTELGAPLPYSLDDGLAVTAQWYRRGRLTSTS